MTNLEAVKAKIAGAEKVLAVAREVGDIEAQVLMQDRIEFYQRMLPPQSLRLVYHNPRELYGPKK